jgi:hypothetical protein
MTIPPIPLDNLAQQIARQQAELDALRGQYEARQNQLADLRNRKEQLQAQLNEVEAEIRSVAQGTSPASVSRPGKSVGLAPKLSGRPKLADLLLLLVRQSTGPITVKQLAEQVVRRKFPTQSSNIPDLVQARVSELVKQGILRRAADRPGVVPGPAFDSREPKPRTGDGQARKPFTRPAKAGSFASRWRTNRPVGQPSLRVALTNALRQNKAPVTGAELARQVKAGGYRTKSKNFVHVVWVMLARMDNIEHVPGKGYRLKRHVV